MNNAIFTFPLKAFLRGNLRVAHDIRKSSRGMESESADNLGCNASRALRGVIGIAMIDHTYFHAGHITGDKATDSSDGFMCLSVGVGLDGR